MRTIRIGSGTGFAGDRIEPAIELERHERLDYFVFECLTERTEATADAMAIGNGRRDALHQRPRCRRRGIEIVQAHHRDRLGSGARKRRPDPT